jgi:hypothetical protein
MAVKIQVEVLWVVTSCSVEVGYQRFGGPCCHHLQGEDPTTSLHGVITQKNWTWSSMNWLWQNWKLHRQYTTKVQLRLKPVTAMRKSRLFRTRDFICVTSPGVPQRSSGWSPPGSSSPCSVCWSAHPDVQFRRWGYESGGPWLLCPAPPVVRTGAAITHTFSF